MRRLTTIAYATTLRSGWRRSRTTSDLLWRSVATIGGEEGVHTLENDTGPDDANHAQDGMIVAAGAGVGARGGLDAHLLDIAPTVLDLFGMDIPPDMRGRSLAAQLAG